MRTYHVLLHNTSNPYKLKHNPFNIEATDLLPSNVYVVLVGELSHQV